MSEFDKELDQFLKSLEGPQDAPVEPAADEFEAPKNDSLAKAHALVQEYVTAMREGGTPVVISDGKNEPYVNVVMLARLIEDMHKIFTVFEAVGAGNGDFAQRHKGFDSLRTALMSVMEAGVADAIKHGEISL